MSRLGWSWLGESIEGALTSPTSASSVDDPTHAPSGYPDGLEASEEEWLDGRGLLPAVQATEPSFAPASDRFVTRADNEPAFEGLDSALANLGEAVRGTNELSDDERELALVELAVIERAVSQPRVSIDLVQRFNRSVLTWLAKKFADGIVKAAVTAVVAALAAAIGHASN